ncbi:serine/threonine protein kinase [Corallococcus sp. 4LFB]|uniref:serine/threonine protein kinase n=1 Tax=Corallococcus sp. 4LFB TaxID=3383249 RepID=UPI0039760D4D
MDLADTHPDPKLIIEMFKFNFGDHNSSSDMSWAVSDLERAMSRRATNAVVFISNFWSAIEEAQKMELVVPPQDFLNKIISKNKIPFAIQPPNIVKAQPDSEIGDSSQETKSDNYVLGKLLGEGGFGSVYMATRSTSVASFDFAIKIHNPSPLNEDSSKAQARFQREIQAIKSLQHRGIVPYFDAGIDRQGRPYLVMPIIKGKDLREAASAEPFMQRVALMTDVLDAVKHAHDNDVLHRDLKPSNIIVRASDRQPIIVDFGASYVIDQLDKQSLTTKAVGSIGYMPSEVLANPKNRSPLHDIYSCAVITYEIIAGHRPDSADPMPLAAVDPLLTPLDRVLRRALGPASRRHPSASELRNEFLEVLSKTSRSYN